jgi:hypothetical protein
MEMEKRVGLVSSIFIGALRSNAVLLHVINIVSGHCSSQAREGRFQRY